MKRIYTIQLLISALTVLLCSSCKESATFTSNTFKSDVFTQLFNEDRYDFLWVFDNSDSMKDKRDYVKDNMQNFLTILSSRKAIDYQMAIITTDYFTDGGNLIQSSGGKKVVKSTSGNPEGDFADIINQVSKSATSFWEQGLEASYQAISNHSNTFMRSGVPLVVIYLSDENDFSCQSNCFGVEPENNNNWVPYPISRYSTFFSNLSNSNRVSIFPIVGMEQSSCDVASLGERYMDLEEVSAFGDNGSICLNELPAAYENIARTIADKGVVFSLSYPADVGKGMNVYVDLVEVPYSETNGYYYDASSNSIVFTGSAIPNNGSTIEVLYAQVSQ